MSCLIGHRAGTSFAEAGLMTRPWVTAGTMFCCVLAMGKAWPELRFSGCHDTSILNIERGVASSLSTRCIAEFSRSVCR
ncbi:uncharacterized protein M421DRAFT_375198 [Didymella exigua CBS 183.55]|uniref:Uncharacterized protein n=1 Tax=Didymella exigua CBS 183.55 TaxID=1150837 RepID=A0A6A5RTY3_9PLEO|nr:uncharacterized protein M421DRAFT_375198 [Didymella exigua CBS 183.55]KAF1930478.1 hypothetical protein M421DRAFT_375198 [Didymella exigua CBS 183.55]